MANIMIQGTTSSAGKSFISTALCRIFTEDGYRVCPFKSQNMSSKSYTTKEGYIMSPAQVFQAWAANRQAHPNMNPILLQPLSEQGSRVIIQGREEESMEAREYFKFRNSLKPMIKDTYKGIEKDNDLVVIEGAGSPAEINLKENDIVNMGMAEIADAPVLLVADIDRGGVFASLYGTVMLLEDHERARIKGLIINKFRGDKSLLDPGIDMIEELLNIPVVGTIPYMDLQVIQEDNLANNDKISNMKEYVKTAVENEFKEISRLVRENIDLSLVYEIIGIKK